MAKKMMILTGSPRKNGNTNTVVGWFAEGAKESGAKIELIDITKLKSTHHGCIGCLGCQKSEKYECAVKDEVQPVLARIPSSDVVVFATPTYFFGPSAQLKSLLDRMYSLIKFNGGAGGYEHNLGQVEFAVIATAGGGLQPGLQLIEDTFKTIAGFAGTACSSLLVPHASMHSDDLKQDRDLRERAAAFGRKLASS
jgi:multimeric flavodoxin WrbA